MRGRVEGRPIHEEDDDGVGERLEALEATRVGGLEAYLGEDVPPALVEGLVDGVANDPDGFEDHRRASRRSARLKG